jgi:hypothetical protein
VDPLLGIGRKRTGFHGNESTNSNRGTVGSGVSVVRTATVAAQRRGKHASAATIELQQ